MITDAELENLGWTNTNGSQWENSDGFLFDASRQILYRIVLESLGNCSDRSDLIQETEDA